MDRERATQALMHTRDAQLLLGRALFLQSKQVDPDEVLEAWEEARECLWRAVHLLSENSQPASGVPWVQEAKPS